MNHLGKFLLSSLCFNAGVVDGWREVQLMSGRDAAHWILIGWVQIRVGGVSSNKAWGEGMRIFIGKNFFLFEDSTWEVYESSRPLHQCHLFITRISISVSEAIMAGTRKGERQLVPEPY